MIRKRSAVVVLGALLLAGWSLLLFSCGSQRIGTLAQVNPVTSGDHSGKYRAYWLDSRGLLVKDGGLGYYVDLAFDSRTKKVSPIVYAAATAGQYSIGNGLYARQQPLSTVPPGVEPLGDWSANVALSGSEISFTTMKGERLTVQFRR